MSRQVHREAEEVFYDTATFTMQVFMDLEKLLFRDGGRIYRKRKLFLAGDADRFVSVRTRHDPPMQGRIEVASMWPTAVRKVRKIKIIVDVERTKGHENPRNFFAPVQRLISDLVLAGSKPGSALRNFEV